ncbi:MAG: alpha/beta hydrolase [Sedimentisphaerales bacterium]|nr:alpha/beta hydrolase [Sedimentisphaerales bacterium]
MRRDFGILFEFFIIISVLAGTVRAGETSALHKIELLWPNGAPGAKGSGDKDKPTLTICLPDKETAVGTAVVVCPGGGYGFVSMDREGQQIADWLNSIGVAAFILNYRHNGVGYIHPAPLQDAQRAVRIVRSRAQEWDIIPERIGIMGFSAGGHLASSLGTHFQNNYYDVNDAVDKISCRPDFMILLYPVITLDDSFTHSGSKRNLLGEKPDPKLVENLSGEKQVTSQTPPSFLVHSSEDKTVPVENSINFYLALRKAGVPAEMHIYLKGSHGSAIEDRYGVISTWPERCIQWMNVLGLLDKKTIK